MQDGLTGLTRSGFPGQELNRDWSHRCWPPLTARPPCTRFKNGQLDIAVMNP